MAQRRQDNPPRKRPRRWFGRGAVALSAVSAVGLGVLLGGGWPAILHPGAWVVRAVGSELFLTCAIVALLCATGVCGLGAALWRLGRPCRMQPRDGQGGSAILEFTIVIPILGTLAMIMVQAAFLMGGNLCVHYAAYCAARAAVVQVPRDETFAGEEPNAVDPGPGSRKMIAIRDAAVMAVMPVSAGGEGMPEGDDLGLGDDLKSVFDAYGQDAPGWIDSRLGRKFRYAWDHTFVKLDPPADGWRYAPGEDLKVTVTHTLYMSVPYANWLFGHLDDDGVELASGDGEWGMVIRATCYMPNEGTTDVIEIEEFDVDE